MVRMSHAGASANRTAHATMETYGERDTAHPTGDAHRLAGTGALAMTATDTVSVLPNVVTDGTATITEDYAVTYAEEHDGDTITVWAWATLTTGSATYGGRHVGMASGDI